MTLNAARLGLVPRPQDDETLSSFLLRLARNHSAEPHEFCAMVWPGLHFWTRDIDRTASNAVIESVARATGLASAEVERMTLRVLVERMGHPLTNTGIQHGILPVGVYHRVRRRHGQQYCPVCLKSDPPYLRRRWRLEWVTCCDVHQRLLSDACPSCDAPFIPHRANSLIERKCHQCRASLLVVAHKDADADVLLLQRFLSAMESGDLAGVSSPLLLATCRQSEHDVFDAVRRLCRLLKFLVDGQWSKPRRAGGSWEYLRTSQRGVVLRVVSQWLFTWPDSFLTWAQDYNVSQDSLKEFGPWPSWTQPAISQLRISPPRKKRRRPITIASLRRKLGNTPEYRIARAKFLLDKALKGMGR